MYLSILCNESFPFIKDNEVAQISKGTYIGDFRIRAQREMCAGWPNANVPRSFVEPVLSDKPVLLLSGELDPAAQPEYAAEEAKYLVHSKHFIVRNGSHDLGAPCISVLTLKFIDSGSTEGLDTSCVDQFPLPAFKLRDPNQVSIPAKILAEYVGTYELQPGVNVTVTVHGSVLMLQPPGPVDKVPLYPESETRFFMMQADNTLEFFKEESGTVTHFVMHRPGHDLNFARK